MKRLSLALSLLIAVAAFAQSEPRLNNARLQTASAAAGLDKTVRSIVAQNKGPLWIGYAVATQSRARLICCFDNMRQFEQRGSCAAGCRLEGRHGSSFVNSRGGTCVDNQPQTEVFVLLRAEAGKITKVRPFTPDCALDAGNLPVYWLTDVRDAESVSLLTALARRSSDLDSSDSAQGALDAIALHKDPSADSALESFLTPQNSSELREHASFWIAQERGHHGFEVLRRYMRTDSDEDFRKHLTFAISQSDDAESVPELVRAAHQDHSSEVRGQALFWLAQKAGKKVAGEISDAIENDPDTDVKKKAVFALTQMPDEEGVPKLIEVAKSNRNPVVRKEAIFWLGQSEDPRALAYIEQILLK